MRVQENCQFPLSDVTHVCFTRFGPFTKVGRIIIRVKISKITDLYRIGVLYNDLKYLNSNVIDVKCVLSNHVNLLLHKY